MRLPASMPTADALITIGITCFNEGDWLLECWDSVLAQTDDRWVAVLVLDGGASGRTQEIFDQLEHPKLRKFSTSQNVGPYPSRNKAFELTDTPYHFYLDADDQLVPESVALTIRTFEEHPEAAFVYGDYECFEARNEVWRYPKTIESAALVESQQTPGACAYKKETWQALGGFSVELARGNADYDFLIGAFESGLTGIHCSHTFYRYRVGHPSKISQSYNCRYHETHEVMVRRHPRFFSVPARRRRFLERGYRRAAVANRNEGHAKEAARLAALALRQHLSSDLELWNALREGYLPGFVNRGLTALWRLRKGSGRFGQR